MHAFWGLSEAARSFYILSKTVEGYRNANLWRVWVRLAILRFVSYQCIGHPICVMNFATVGTKYLLISYNIAMSSQPNKDFIHFRQREWQTVPNELFLYVCVFITTMCALEADWWICRFILARKCALQFMFAWNNTCLE